MNRAKVEDALLAMGVPAGIKGFTYITDAIQIFDERGTNIRMTKELYPTIAKNNGTTPSIVERPIRYALTVARDCRGKYEIINHYIGFANCKNSSSIKQLHMMLKREDSE